MKSIYLDLTSILNRVLERASENLSFNKLLVQIGIDPSNVTFDAIIHRLVDIVLANINVASMCALVGAGFYAATMLMRTMVPLRVFGIISALFFMAYGAFAGAISTFLMYLLLLPINSWRLYQMRSLVKRARIAAQGDLSMDWLKPFMNRRAYRQGDVLFRKGQPATEMYLTVTGKFLVTEIGIELPPGRLMGELGFITPNNKRTQTVECIQSGEVLTITYDRLLEIYFENPEFGYYFLRLTSDRLIQNIARLEGMIRAEQGQAAGGPGKRCAMRSDLRYGCRRAARYTTRLPRKAASATGSAKIAETASIAVPSDDSTICPNVRERRRRNPMIKALALAVLACAASASAARASEITRQAASSSAWTGRRLSNCRRGFATTARLRISPAGPTARTIAASTINFITARRRLSAAATSATAIATGTACCAVTFDELIANSTDRGRQIRRFGAVIAMLSKPLRISFRIV